MENRKPRASWLARFMEPGPNFYSMLVEQAATTVLGMEALRDWVASGKAERCQLVRDYEKAADKQKLAIREILVDTLITPIDREDIYDLSTRLDEVLNSAKFTVRQIEALNFSVADNTAIRMASALVKGTKHLADGLAAMSNDLVIATNHATLASKCDRKVEKIYRDAMNDLMTQDDIKLIIRSVEVYKTMLLSSQRIEAVGEKMLHVIVKIR